RGVRRLQAEREIQQNEGVDVELRQAGDVDDNPDRDDDRLPDQAGRGARETGKGLRLETKRVVAERRREVGVWKMEAEIIAPGGRVRRRRRRHVRSSPRARGARVVGLCGALFHATAPSASPRTAPQGQGRLTPAD